MSTCHGITLTTRASALPIKAADMRQHCGEIPPDDVQLVTDYIKASWEQLEHDTGRALLNNVYRMSMDGFPESEIIEVPRFPLVSVDSIVYDDDTDGSEQTWDAANYRVSTSRRYGRITPAYDQSWPTTRDQIDAVRITFTAGHGTAESDVPAFAKQALRLYVADAYRFRELGAMDDNTRKAWAAAVFNLGGGKC